MRIAISGDSGCGNSTATRNVGNAMDLEIINYTFRNLAEALELEFTQVQEESTENPIYDYLTDLILIRTSLENTNNVVGTRLASWLIDADLRIWLHASLEARAARIYRRGTDKTNSYEHTLYHTFKRDKQNRERYRKLYGIDFDDHGDFDITINTERLTATQVSGLIVEAARWAKNNIIERPNLHLHRIRKIIAENLDVSHEILFNPNVHIDLRAIYYGWKERHLDTSL